MGFVASSDDAQPKDADSRPARSSRRRAKGGDMRKLWYVSVAPASTAAARPPMRGFTKMSPWTDRAPGALAVSAFAAASGCAGPSASGAGAGGAADLPTAAAPPPPDAAPGAVHANLA